MIPHYTLVGCHQENPHFHAEITTLSVAKNLKTLRLALSDEKTHKLISFTQADAPYQKEFASSP